MKWYPVTEDHHPMILFLKKRVERLEAENKALRDFKFDNYIVSNDDAVELTTIHDKIVLPLAASAETIDLGHGLSVRAWAKTDSSISYAIYLDASRLDYPSEEKQLMLIEVLKQALIEIGNR